MGTGKDLWNEFEPLYNKLDYKGLASLYASDAVFVDPTGRYEGREAIQALFEGTSKAFPDRSIETTLVIEEGDTVVAEWIWRATNTGPLGLPDGTEIPATGKPVEICFVSVWKVSDGIVAAQRDYLDTAAIMSQLGLMPSPPDRTTDPRIDTRDASWE